MDSGITPSFVGLVYQIDTWVAIDFASVFDQVIKHDESYVVQHSIWFSSLICGILSYQKNDLSEDEVGAGPGGLYFDYKLENMFLALLFSMFLLLMNLIWLLIKIYLMSLLCLGLRKILFSKH